MLVIEKFLSPGNKVAVSEFEIGRLLGILDPQSVFGRPHWRDFHSRPSREQFKYSSTRTRPEAAFRLDNAGILVNSGSFIRAFPGGATQGVVAGDLHDRFPGALQAPVFRQIEYMREWVASCTPRRGGAACCACVLPHLLRAGPAGGQGRIRFYGSELTDQKIHAAGRRYPGAAVRAECAELGRRLSVDRDALLH
ncbi:hypothetical protein [Streptomyces sp. bgisy034]|uniref:hypothetical protein n=1 Tax=Streptomyces sp. bgisy034 TaxID=3413774 RepID=UPI003EB830E1